MKQNLRDSTAISHVNEGILHFLRGHFEPIEVEIYGHWVGGASIARICSVYNKNRDQIERVIKKIEKRIFACLSWERIGALLAFEPITISSSSGWPYSKSVPKELDQALATVTAARIDQDASDLGYVRQVIRKDDTDEEFRDAKGASAAIKRVVGMEREYQTPLSVLCLSTGTSSRIQRFCRTVERLCKYTREDLMEKEGFGKTRLLEIERALDLNGFCLRCEQGPGLSELEQLKLSTRALTVLKELNVHSIKDLATITESQLRAARNAGERTFNEIEEAMKSQGLAFAGSQSTT